MKIDMSCLSKRWLLYRALIEGSGLYANEEDLNHIQDLIDAEEQGLLLKLPCKVGDEVFVLVYVHGEWIQPFVVSQISILKYGIEFILSYNGKDEKLRYWSTRKGIEDINSIVFLTKEEAEAKLKEMVGES